MKKSESRSHGNRARLLIIRTVIVLVLAAMVLAAGTNWRARAQTNRFVSPTGNDEGGSNDCSNSGQPCQSLHNAINHSGSGDDIDLAPGTYTENQITIDRDLTIRGDGAAGSTVDGGHAGSVFMINGGVTATLETLTIQNGTAQPATRVLGGGIYNNGGNLTVIGCTITGNSAPQAVVGDTTFFGIGGGIYNAGNLTLINSTVSHNFATLDGGGIDNHNTANIINSTIAFNSADNVGGGIENESVNAILNITNTLIADNAGGDYDNFFGEGKIGTNSHNFVGRGGIPSALTGDPLLGPLQNNGGPTETHALLSGSTAIDAGDDSVLSDPLNLTTDQRGPGFPRLACAHVDIGAYEAILPPDVTCPANITVIASPGQTTASVSFAATANDPCQGALTPVYKIGNTVITSPHTFGVGITTITVSATDTQGLTGTCSFTVFVICAAPTITCPANIAVYSDPGLTTAKVSFAATASDACDGALTPVYTIGSTTITSPLAFPPGVTTVTATATGSNGLTGSCSFTVTVTLLDRCIRDDHTGDTFRFNSITGQYVYMRCADKFTMTGTGTIRNANGLNTLTDSLSDRRINAMFNPGSLTGRATVVLVLAPGVYQTIIVNQTSPSATCTCP